MKRPFGKPATTHAQQVALLQQRGMVVDDPAAAESYLQHLNYYRLGAYWLPFEADHATHTFRPGTRFADVVNLYVVDRELRLLVLDAASPSILQASANVEAMLGFTVDELLGQSIEILGGDLQLDGITKNQSFALDERDKPAEAVLRTILAKSDSAGRLVYVIRKRDGVESIEITTKAAAAKPDAKAAPKKK